MTDSRLDTVSTAGTLWRIGRPRSDATSGFYGWLGLVALMAALPD